MRLRQVALVAKDLDLTTGRLGRLLGIDYGYHDPGIITFGLENWVAAIGDTFLEVVAPVQEGTTAGRLLERRNGDGGYMVILQVPNLEAAKSRVESGGARIVWNARGDGEAGESTEGLHIHPRDCGGAILSIDESRPPEAWVWAGPEWQQHDSSFLSQISGVEIQSADPATMASRWSELLGAGVSEGHAPDARPAWLIDLDSARDTETGDSAANREKRGVIRFVKDENGRGDGVSAFDVEVRSTEALATAVNLLGARLERGEGDCAWVDEAGVRVFFQGTWPSGSARFVHAGSGSPARRPGC